MKRAFALLLLAATAAQAQPAPKSDIETVIVQGQKPPAEQAHDYVRAYAAPAPFLGKITRWNSKKNPICPNTAGFTSSVNAFVTARIRQIAAQVGAPVNPRPNCKPNLAIIITPQPQALLDEIRAHHEDLLGWFQSPSEGDRRAIVKYPIQAWYETATEDSNNSITLDVYYNPLCPLESHCPVAPTSSRVRNELISEIYNVTIVADAGKITGYSLGALADYFAMLALAQTDNFGSCQDVPSITSLMAQDCPAAGPATGLTAIDLAYLKGVYKMDAGGSLTSQRSVIAGEIRKVLESQ